MTHSTTARVIFDAALDGAMSPDAIAQRFTPGLHRVLFMQIGDDGRLVWDHNDYAVVSRVVETADFAEAQALHRDAVIASGTHSAANLSVAAEAFGDDLPAYIRALNTAARLSIEMPQNGTWIGALTDDLYHWADFGVRFPLELEAHLNGCFEREMQKEMMAG